MFRIKELQVNQQIISIDADPQAYLLDVLREQAGLTGAKYGCGEGQCGACTVLIDGHAVRACVTPVEAAAGKPVTTIEGLAQNGRLHPLQQAFLDEGAFQCGFCTCGMILSAAALLKRTPHPSHDEIVASMDGNICRCGTYGRILKAVDRAARSMKGGAA